MPESFLKRMATKLGETMYRTITWSRISSSSPKDETLHVETVLSDGLSKSTLKDFLDKEFPREKYPEFHINIGRSDLGDRFIFHVPVLLNQDQKNEVEGLRWGGPSGLTRKPSEEVLSPEDAKKQRRGGRR